MAGTDEVFSCTPQPSITRTAAGGSHVSTLQPASLKPSVLHPVAINSLQLGPAKSRPCIGTFRYGAIPLRCRTREAVNDQSAEKVS